MRVFIILFLGLFSVCSFGQNKSVSNINLQSSYLLEIPLADLNERYGINNKFEFKLEYLHKYKFAFYIKSGIRLGENVKKDVLNNIRTSEGYVVGVNGFYADIFGRKRGFDYNIGIDKLIQLSNQNEINDQLRIGVSLGSAHHWVKFIDDSQSVAQVSGNYAQVYDHYVSGFQIEQNIQYQWNTSRQNAGFLIGIQCAQLFGKEHRAKYIGMNANSSRFDLYLGLKISYLLPLYTFGEKETIYY